MVLLVGSAAASCLPAAYSQDAGGGISGEITVGTILPLTGVDSGHGEENMAATALAVDDFNEYLEGKGAGWSLRVAVEDSQSSHDMVLENLQVHHSNGISIVLGPDSSSKLQSMKGYADSNGILLFSCCSTSPLLAIEGDLIFRMAPDDTNQGVAAAKLIEDAGIEVVVPVWRQDVWGDGLQESVRESVTARGGTVDAGIGYGQEATEFSAEASILADIVSGYVEEYGADRVAVMYIGFDEGLSYIQAAAHHDILNKVRWFGSDGNARDTELVEDPIGREFAADTQYTAVLVASGKNDISERVDAVLREMGRVPSTYASSTYDVVWVVGLAIEAAQSADPSAVAEAIPKAAAGHVGAIGSTRLNSNGDLAQTNYDVWQVSDGGEWILAGVYFSDKDAIELEAQAAGEPQVADEPGGCLIATAAYGSELAPQVQMLREIRDGALFSTESGTSFMAGFNQMYYSFSPAVADLERESPAFRDAVRAAITPGVYALGIMTLADRDSEHSVILFGMLSLAALAAVYAAGPLLAVRAVRRIRRAPGRAVNGGPAFGTQRRAAPLSSVRG